PVRPEGRARFLYTRATAASHLQRVLVRRSLIELGPSRHLLGADPGKGARPLLVDVEVSLDTFAQLEPDDSHLQTLAADAGRPGQLANVLRAPPRQRFVHEFSVFEQAHSPKDKRLRRSLCSKWINFQDEPSDSRVRSQLVTMGAQLRGLSLPDGS